MKNYIFFFVLVFLALSCKMLPGSDRHAADIDEKKVYKLRLNPPAGSAYHYDITNETEFKLEVNDKKIDNRKGMTVGVDYRIQQDSAGDFVIGIKYTKIRLHSRNGDGEEDKDAANAATSVDPTEKMFGVLLSADLVSVVSPAGEVKAVKGYKELADKIMAETTGIAGASREAIQKRLEQMILNGIIKKNMDQLFKNFPDSAVHIGDTWKLNSTQKEDIPIHVTANYAIKDISGGIALIHSEGEILSDSSMTQMMGYQVTVHIKGSQEGDYEMETATGMLQTAGVKMHVEGTIQLLGKEIPLNLETTIKINGRKME